MNLITKLFLRQAKTQLNIKWRDQPILSLAYSKLSIQSVNNYLQAGPNPLNSSEFDSLTLNYPNNHIVLIYKNVLAVENKVTGKVYHAEHVKHYYCYAM